MIRWPLPAITLFAAILLSTLSACNAGEPGAPTVTRASATGAAENPRVAIDTSKGRITIELFVDKAPKSSENFLGYVRSGFYDGTVFHRVIPGFMIQGGGMTADMTEKPNGQPIANEADNGLRNLRGTLAMARTMDPHSATSQFFINVADNGFLDHRGKSMQGWGYAVFGQVVDGMDVVDAIVAVPRGRRGPHDDVPLEAVVMQHVTVLPQATPAAAASQP